jgi:CRP-like cAMP-binding protein
LLNLVGPHEAFGLPLLKEDESRVMGAAVYRPAVVLSMSREDLFKSMDESPQLMRNVYQELTTTARKLLLHTQSLVTTHLDGRLATLLLRLARKDLNPVSMIDMPLSQAEIAGWLGASRGRLNRAMNRLTQQGLIRVDGQKILILDPAGLRRITGEQGNPPL